MKFLFKAFVILLATQSVFASNTNEDFTIKDSKSIQFSESIANGTNTVSLSAPTTLTNSITLTLPDGVGGVNQILQTDGSGVLTWGSATTAVNTLTSTSVSLGLSANMGKTLEDKKADKSYLIYGIDTDPYSSPTTVAEAKTQAKAQLEKKRIDYIEATYSAIQRNKDIVDLNSLMIKKINGETLTTDEQTKYSNIKDRMKWYSDTLGEADTYRTNIDAAATISAILAVATNANFTSTFTASDVALTGSLTATTVGSSITFTTVSSLATGKSFATSDFAISNTNTSVTATISSVSYSGNTVTLNLSRTLKTQTNGSEGAGSDETMSIAFTKSSSTANLDDFSAQIVTNNSTAENCQTCTLDSNGCPF